MTRLQKLEKFQGFIREAIERNEVYGWRYPGYFARLLQPDLEEMLKYVYSLLADPKFDEDKNAEIFLAPDSTMEYYVLRYEFRQQPGETADAELFTPEQRWKAWERLNPNKQK